MLHKMAYLLVSLSSLSVPVKALSPWASSLQGVNFWLRDEETRRRSLATVTTDSLNEHQDQAILSKATQVEFAELYFDQPLDHFPTNHSDASDVRFGQRYWVSDRHFVEGGPVIVLDGGETSGENRLPFLDTGIVDVLAKATKGLGVVLEHRYYGKSIPVEDFSTDSMRWLNNAQALEDSAQFIANFKWNGTSLSSLDTKWIYYGGSYAGARAAHMRVLYPELVYGSIASSAVTHAAVNYWEYMDAIRTTANQTCTTLLTEAVAHIDTLLNTTLLSGPLKASFHLQGLSNGDFASVISYPLSGVQQRNWDPAVGSDEWTRFCSALGSGKANSPYASIRVPSLISNYGEWIRKMVVKDCVGRAPECCSEWGYFISAPPDADYPTVVSRSLSLQQSSKFCQQAFPPGKYIKVPDWPNVTVVNELGDFDLAADRIAFIDGDEDPWQHATPHSRCAPSRADTITRPFKWIKTGIHHYDEFGLKNHSLEPPHIQEIHREEVEFVKAWLELP